MVGLCELFRMYHGGIADRIYVHIATYFGIYPNIGLNGHKLLKFVAYHICKR